MAQPPTQDTRLPIPGASRLLPEPSPDTADCIGSHGPMRRCASHSRTSSLRRLEDLTEDVTDRSHRERGRRGVPARAGVDPVTRRPPGQRLSGLPTRRLRSVAGPGRGRGGAAGSEQLQMNAPGIHRPSIAQTFVPGTWVQPCGATAGRLAAPV